MEPDRDRLDVAILSPEPGGWTGFALPRRIGSELDAIVGATRAQAAEQSAFAVVNVEDDFFVVVRVDPAGVRYLLSDATAAVAWSIAAQVVERLGVPTPDDDDLDEVVPVGDLAIFLDFGLGEEELGLILDDPEAYADELLSEIVDRIGAARAYGQVLGEFDRR